MESCIVEYSNSIRHAQQHHIAIMGEGIVDVCVTVAPASGLEIPPQQGRVEGT